MGVKLSLKFLIVHQNNKKKKKKNPVNCEYYVNLKNIVLFTTFKTDCATTVPDAIILNTFRKSLI